LRGKNPRRDIRRPYSATYPGMTLLSYFVTFELPTYSVVILVRTVTDLLNVLLWVILGNPNQSLSDLQSLLTSDFKGCTNVTSLASIKTHSFHSIVPISLSTRNLITVFNENNANRRFVKMTLRQG